MSRTSVSGLLTAGKIWKAYHDEDKVFLATHIRGII